MGEIIEFGEKGSDARPWTEDEAAGCLLELLLIEPEAKELVIQTWGQLRDGLIDPNQAIEKAVLIGSLHAYEDFVFADHIQGPFTND